MTPERLDEIETWIHEHCMDEFPYAAIIALVAEVRRLSADLLGNDGSWSSERYGRDSRCNHSPLVVSCTVCGLTPGRTAFPK